MGRHNKIISPQSEKQQCKPNDEWQWTQGPEGQEAMGTSMDDAELEMKMACPFLREQLLLSSAHGTEGLDDGFGVFKSSPKSRYLFI